MMWTTAIVLLATAMAAAEGRTLFDSAQCSSECVYDIKIEMAWSGENHPVDYPSNAHFAPFWAVVHNDNYVMWRRDEMASNAMKEIAELGSGKQFREEVDACGGDCGEVYEWACEPESGTCTASGQFTATPDRPYISIAGMLVPSPDWYTGVDSWDLCGDSGWTDSMSTAVQAYDAGTDLGATFDSPDQGTEEREPIFSFGGLEPPSSSIFYNADLGEIVPMGTITITGCVNDGSYSSNEPEATTDDPEVMTDTTSTTTSSATDNGSSSGTASTISAGSFSVGSSP